VPQHTLKILNPSDHPRFQSSIESFRTEYARVYPSADTPEVTVVFIGLAHNLQPIFRVSTPGQLAIEGHMLAEAFAKIFAAPSLTRSSHTQGIGPGIPEEGPYLDGSVYTKVGNKAGHAAQPTLDFIYEAPMPTAA